MLNIIMLSVIMLNVLAPFKLFSTKLESMETDTKDDIFISGATSTNPARATATLSDNTRSRSESESCHPEKKVVPLNQRRLLPPKGNSIRMLQFGQTELDHPC